VLVLRPWRWSDLRPFRLWRIVSSFLYQDWMKDG
jgi:hypothetical protein